MTKKTIRSDDRAFGAAVVAGLFAFVGAGMSAVAWGFGINETGATFIVLWLLIFLVLSLGWRNELPPPGSKKAPTTASHTAGVTPGSAPAPRDVSSAAPTAKASAPSSGTASSAAPTPAPAPPAEPVIETAPAATVKAPVEAEGSKPVVLEGARDGKPDDLKQIKGVGPALERLCNSLGFYHFDQIANWTPQEVAWVDQNLEGFKGRVSRDDWVAQAKALAAGGS